jgi:hypothetical protein
LFVDCDRSERRAHLRTWPPFALNAREPPVEIEDEIAPRALINRRVDVDPELDRLRSDRRFRNRSLLVRREHGPMLVA